MTPRAPGPSPAERAYALLLRLYPPSFRARFGDAMRDAFRDQWRDHARARPGAAARARFWAAVVADAARHGLAERAAERAAEIRWGRALGPDYFPPRGHAMGSFWHDVRFAVRTHLANRAATLVAVLVLAIAIGANTAIFSVVEGVLLRSLPFRDPEQLVGVGPTFRKFREARPGFATGSRLAFETWRAQRDAFVDAAGYEGADPILTGLGDPARVMVFRVTGNFFSLLGAGAALGRPVIAEDAAPGAPPVVVLSHAFWSTRLGADPAAIGRTLVLGGVPHTVIGVMPRAFRFPERAELWRSFSDAPAGPGGGQRGAFGGYWTVARLRPGVSADHAEARLDITTAALARTERGWKDIVAEVMPLHDQLVGEVRRPLLLVLGAVAFVLLVACANVANILLARAVARRREVAVRLAVGAGRARLVRQLLTESVLLALAGGALGVLLAYFGVPLLVSLGGEELPRVAELGVNGRVLAATLAACVATGIVFGLAPALQSVRRSSPLALKESADVVEVADGRRRVGDVLGVAQVALTMVLLAGAALLAVSFGRLVRVDTGFTPERLLVAQMNLRGGRYATDTTRLAFARALVDRARAIPGVGAAAVATGTPLAIGALGSIKVDGAPTAEDAPATMFTSATADYFRVLGIPLRRGRLPADGAADRDAVVVNEALARAFFPGQDPIGRRVSFYGGSMGRTIVGVVGDTKAMSLDAEAPPQIFQSYSAHPEPYVKLVVRATGDPAALARAVRAAVRELDPGLPLDKLSTMRELMSESVTRQRFYATLLAVFAGSALVMAAAGMYGVVSYAVTRRTRELGVRVALGATAADVLRLVVGRSGRLALTGIALGALGALWATRVLRGMLYDVTPTDPAVLAGVAALLAAVALVASWLPGRRAARVDPARTLRGA